MLSVQQLRVKGRREDLSPRPHCRAAAATLLVAGERQDQRTAFALTLSGRMKASAGS